MVIFNKKWKKYNEIQLTKNIMDLNIRKMTNHPPSPGSMARRVLMTEVSGGRVRGRPRLGWMDDVKVALGNNRGMTVEATRQCAKDRKEWRALVHM